MNVSGNSSDYADSPEVGVTITRAEFEPVPANCSVEVLREVIGRKVMTWVGAGAVQQCEDESEGDHKGS